jgi:hypothetical protein
MDKLRLVPVSHPGAMSMCRFERSLRGERHVLWHDVVGTAPYLLLEIAGSCVKRIHLTITSWKTPHSDVIRLGYGRRPEISVRGCRRAT